MSTLQQVELGVLGPLQVRQYGLPVSIPGAKPRAILTMLGLRGGSIVSAETLVELLWGDDPPRTAAKALPTHISTLRRTLGDGFVLTAGTGWALGAADVDANRYTSAAKLGREALSAGDPSQAVTRFDEALALWRDTPELPDGPRGVSERTRWIEGHAALAEDRADALLATGRAAEIIGELEAAISEAPLRERRWGQLMLALYRAGRQGEALGAYQRARSLLAEELGVDPGPDLRRLEAAIVAQDAELEVPVTQQLQTATRTVTFLLTDIEGSTAAWEADTDAMAVALARHDELVEQVVTSRGGRLVKTRGEGDATFSVFDRASAAAASAIELQEAIRHEPWALQAPMRIRVALHTGEVELRDGDYFGRAVNRAARLRSLAAGGQILCSGATAELVIDSLPEDVVLADVGMRQLKNLIRPEHVFELRLEAAEDASASTTDASIERPELPAVLAGHGPFVGRGRELEGLLSAWQTVLATGAHAVLIAGEPGVGKTRLAGEWARQAHELGALVLYGRCDEDLGAPYQPFSEALRSLVPRLGSDRLRSLRGVRALLPLIPGLADDLPDLVAPTHADADTERYALFDAVAALLGVVCTSAPVVVILDDLHWAAKPTLLLLRHLLRFGEHAPVQIVGTYRSTDLDRAHPLAAMLTDLHREDSADRLALSGLEQDDITAYVAEAGYDDEELARALASVTGGNPFFLIEALRHVDESGGRWDPRTLPQGVREAVSRRLSRLMEETNTALAAAAVVGSRFSLDLVERVTGDDLIDAFDEASKAGIVIEEPGGRYRFNHALVRQSLLAELASVRRMRLHQRIATTLEAEPGADDELLAELAYHYFECAWAGNAAKAVEYCRRAADQAMARLAYEGAADLYDKALHALDELDDELPNRDDQQAELLIARCEALLAAGEVVSAARAVSQLQAATRGSARLAAWGTCFDGQLSMLTDPERLDDIEAAVSAAAEKLAELDDAAGEAKAHTVRAACLARLGRIGDAETALDQALTAARRAHEHRRVNNVLANAPLAALWGPNPVPRAGGRCLDVVRLLRITTGSPVVEATSTRCQGVLDAFRGRAAAGRRLIDSARRTLTELGMRHALLEVEQFAGIVELVADDPAAAEPHLRRACDGFRRMGLDVDTAETAALLARACLALDRDAEADELCKESERLAGHALKASIAWRTVRAQLLARRNHHDEAKRVAEEAERIAAGTDLLVDHGDACLALATVLIAGGDAAGAQTAAEKAAGLYESKGAAALVEKARNLLGEPQLPTAAAPPEVPAVEIDNDCVRAVRSLEDAGQREAWDESEQFYAPDVSVESRRKVVGFTPADLRPGDWPRVAQHLREGWAWHRSPVIAVRGERLALTRIELGTDDASPGAPHEEFLGLWGLDEDGRIALQVFFDVEDIDAAVAELDARHAGLEADHPREPLQNAASRAEQHLNALFADRRWDDIAALLADDVQVEERRRGFPRESTGQARLMTEVHVIADLGVKTITSDPVAIRGERLVLSRVRFSGRDVRPDAYRTDMFRLAEIDNDGRVVSYMKFDIDDLDTAVAELDARYLAGEAAPYADNWRVCIDALCELNRHELGPILRGLTFDNHRRASFASEDYQRAVKDLWTLVPDAHYRVPVVYELDAQGALLGLVVAGIDTHGTEVQWVGNISWMFEQSRADIYEADDLDAALARFEELHAQRPGRGNAASQVNDRFNACFAARDWDAMAQIVAENMFSDDRRRVVNAGIRRGRDVVIADVSALADLGVMQIASEVVATRGECLVLSRARYSGSDEQPDAFRVEAFDILEIDAEELVAARVFFDRDDIDAAFAELDARYLAGEAAQYSETWSNVSRAFSAINRHELVGTTAKWVNVDHRRATSFAPGELTANIRASWDLTPGSIYIEAVHRLTPLGAVITYAAQGGSLEGFDAEWCGVTLLMIDGAKVSRCEVFEETDLDIAIARFEQLSGAARRLENAASRVAAEYLAHFAPREWDAMTEMLADDFSADDRRHVVNAGVRRGRNTEIANLQAIAEVGCVGVTSTAIATRGTRLALVRDQFSIPDSPEPLRLDVIDVIEIDADNRIAAYITFDHDDFDAAMTELDSRYLAGEAAAHARAWLLITRAYAGLNRREIHATTPDFVNIDHRRGAPFAPGEGVAYFHASWELAADQRVFIETVHRLSDLGAVFTHVGTGTPQDDFEAEWRAVDIITIEGDLINRGELFDGPDLDSALARFEELHQAERLENSASRMNSRAFDALEVRDWDAMAEILAEDVSIDDRRRVVNAGVQYGRDAAIAQWQATAGVGVTKATSVVMATRGELLVLSRDRILGGDEPPNAFYVELLHIVEINTDERTVARVVFDVDDIDAAFNELDARFLVGEAAAHAHTWSVLTRGNAAINRNELPATTSDWINIDHRRGTSFAPGDLFAFVRASWDQIPDISFRIVTVHRLSNLGAVVSVAANGTSQEGFDAEWGFIHVVTAEGDLLNRSELFDETDLDAALARFDDLNRPAPQLENAASRMYNRFNAYLTARNWDGMAEMIADDVWNDDRRRVVNTGVLCGRDAQIANLRAIVDVGAVTNVESNVIAIRAERLALTRTRVSGSGEQSEAWDLEMFTVVEVDTDNRIAAGITFDLDEIDAAIAELEARYLAGEAAGHAGTWSVLTQGFAAANRGEVESAALEVVNVDHRHLGMIESGKLIPFLRETFDGLADIENYVEAVHRLTDAGAVVTHVAAGTSKEGFYCEWRMIVVILVNEGLWSRMEMYDETDLDAALARFDELNRPKPSLENAASRVTERFWACFATRDWGTMAAMLSDDTSSDDRRRVVGSGVLHGREASIVDIRAIAGVGATDFAPTAIIATRGERLVLGRFRVTGADQAPQAIYIDMLGVVEIDATNRIVARVAFDADDVDAAFAELDARYAAGEAAAYSPTWLGIARACAAFNRHEFYPTTPDWVNVDHRQVLAFAPGDLSEYIRAAWSQIPDLHFRVEIVHRVSNSGAVYTQVMTGASKEGFIAEWRLLTIMMFDGDSISRVEFFDEADLETAIPRFDELQLTTSRLENAAGQLTKRYWKHFAVRNWDAMAALLADDISTDDRRPVVGAGLRHGRDAEIAEVQTTAKLGTKNGASIVIAVRGERLALVRMLFSGRDQRPDAFHSEVLAIIEINADNMMNARVMFDINDISAATEELDARYLAGEAAAHSRTWSMTVKAVAAFNRGELPDRTPDFVFVDHRQFAIIEAAALEGYAREAWDQTPDLTIRIEAVYRLNGTGLVFALDGHGTSQDGFDAEWRMIELLTGDGDLVNRIELFDEADLDTALARFVELSRPAQRLQNAASRIEARVEALFAARAWDAMAEIQADECFSDDRRPVVGAGVRRGPDAAIVDARALANIGTKRMTSTVIATRGERLALNRISFVGDDARPEAFQTEVLTVIEVTADNRMAARIAFDVDDIDVAFAELDARYLADGAAECSQTWSVISAAVATLNRRELPASTPDWVNIDHRRAVAFAPGDMTANIRAAWEQTSDHYLYVEAVHRLTNVGALITRTVNATSREGFEAEWRVVEILMVRNNLISRLEIFDGADLADATRRFDELNTTVPPLENAASRANDRYRAYFAARDWDALADMLAANVSTDDRRRILNAGTQHGRDAVVADMLASAGVGATNIASTVIATRGERLILTHARMTGRDKRVDAFQAEALGVLEIDTDERFTARISFDPDDIDAAFVELDARYLAGEAANHAHTWSVLADAYTSINRREMPPMARERVNADHRQLVAMVDSDLSTDMRAGWDQMPNFRIHIETLHRLTNIGAVVTQVSKGISRDGLDAEWRQINLLTVNGDLIDHIEIFDEGDLDVALARFEELSSVR